MTPISFFAEGTPKGMPRPRAFARQIGGKFVARVYNPADAEGWKGAVALAARPFLPVDPIREPVALSLCFLFPRPKAHFRANGQLRPDAPMYHVHKPDCDNIAKAVCDALKTIGMFADDSLIVSLEVVKLYAFGARTGCKIEVSIPSSPFAQEQWDKEKENGHNPFYPAPTTIKI